MKAFQVLVLSVFPSMAVAEDLEGIWFGGVGNGPQEWSHQGASVSFQPYIVDDLVQVIVNFNGWKGIGFGQCVYYGRLDGSGAASLLLSEGKSANTWEAVCTKSSAARLKRLSLDKIEFTMDGIAGLAPGAIELSEALRALAPEEMPVLPEGADILGLTIGMDRADAEAILNERGYAEDARQTRGMQGASWSAAFVTYAKPPVDGQRSSDAVTLSYTAVPEDGSNMPPERVMALQRNVEVDVSEGLQPEVIRKALSDKYGPVEGDGGPRYFDRSGQMADFGTWCGTGTMQGFPWATAYRSGGTNSPYCGTEVSTGFNIDISTGLVRSYHISIISTGIAANDFWYRIRGGIGQEIDTFLAANAGDGAKAPDL